MIKKNKITVFFGLIIILGILATLTINILYVSKKSTQSSDIGFNIKIEYNTKTYVNKYYINKKDINKNLRDILSLYKKDYLIENNSIQEVFILNSWIKNNNTNKWIFENNVSLLSKVKSESIFTLKYKTNSNYSYISL